MTTTYLPQFLLLLAGCPRLFGMVALAPGFNAAHIPPPVRVGLALALALALGPMLAAHNPRLAQLPAEGFILMLLGELVVGLVMGFCLAGLMEAARLAGEAVDLQIGFRAGEMYDPLAGGSSSILGRLWYLLAAVIFFLLDGHHWLIAGLARSYELCPVGELIYQQRLGLLAIEVVSALFSLGLRLAAPLIAALLLADLTMGLVGRGMPQMNLMLVGMPAKILLGLAALAACSPLIAGQLGQVVELYRGLLPQALGLMR